MLNIPTVKEKSEKFAIRIQNLYSLLVDKVNGDIENLNSNLI